VGQILYRQEVGVPLSERLKTGELIGPTEDERLTLVTCWPYGVDDHRLIVIARPAP
jgi:sortase A